MNDDIRPDLPDDALRSSLRHAADDVAFAVPDLLPQARAARRGRRMRATVAGSGLVVAALLIIPPMFGPSRAVPPRAGGWIKADEFGWTCCVEQGQYGH